jgi:hypothetical protein
MFLLLHKHDDSKIELIINSDHILYMQKGQFGGSVLVTDDSDVWIAVSETLSEILACLPSGG